MFPGIVNPPNPSLLLDHVSLARPRHTDCHGQKGPRRSDPRRRRYLFGLERPHPRGRRRLEGRRYRHGFAPSTRRMFHLFLYHLVPHLYGPRGLHVHVWAQFVYHPRLVALALYSSLLLFVIINHGYNEGRFGFKNIYNRVGVFCTGRLIVADSLPR